MVWRHGANAAKHQKEPGHQTRDTPSPVDYVRSPGVQEEIAEDYGVSQPTISRAISAITPLLVQVLAEYVPTADDLTVVC
jgi:hypothetical protein